MNQVAARILVVDDHPVVRSGLKTLIGIESDLVVVGEAATAAEAVQRVAADSPDLVLMDVRLPDRSGISACHEIRMRFPEVEVLILTSYADEFALSSAIAAGAAGYVLKSVRAHALVNDMRRVLCGERLFEHGSEGIGPQHLLTELSPQEGAVAGYVAQGLTNREIAKQMRLAEKTVKNYVSNVLTKLGMTRRTAVAAYVARVQAMSPASPGHSSSSKCVSSVAADVAGASSACSRSQD